MNLPKRAIIGCVLIVLSVGALFYYWHKTWPYGVRTCYLPCMMSALRGYSSEHEGWYPKGGKTALESLQVLRHEQQDYLGNWEMLAGISGNREETERRLKAGLPLDESVSSWIYFPGFRDDDDDKLAIIWERHGGIGFNGRSANGHAVGFSDGHHEQVPQTRWAEFLQQQEALRQSALAKRGVISTNNVAVPNLVP